MGEVEIVSSQKTIIIHSNILLYGYQSSQALAYQVADEIETMWNEANGSVQLLQHNMQVVFKIRGYYWPTVVKKNIAQNVNARNNYFRIEEEHEGNISFVDAVGSNTGYWLLKNLYSGSTTAAHEYGHTIGLLHPNNLDLRTQGIPGIMYPRGTYVDAQYQYDPTKPAGEEGGFMHPMHRKVKQADIDLLNIPSLNFNSDGMAVIGQFTNIHHPNYGR